MNRKKVVNERFAKGKGEYEKVISTIAQKGKCPFCPRHFKYHKNPVLKRAYGWLITKSSWPYPNAEFHFLLIGVAHKESFDEITPRDLQAIRTLVRWAVKTYDLKGGGLIMRFGDTDRTGATVSHLHAHLVQPKLWKSGRKTGHSRTVWFPIG